MRYRSIFISDVHLGSLGCQAEKLTTFLKNNESENLYLVGDIIDGWRLKDRWYWPQGHSNVIRRILTKAKRDTNVYYITGNHDEFLRKWTNQESIDVGNISIIDNKVYEALDGKKYFVVHGDMFDSLMRSGKWLMFVGDFIYDQLIRLNMIMNKIGRFFGLPYWSLSKFLKENTKAALVYIQRYENYIVEYCKKNKYDGVITGHIHTPKIKNENGIVYMNCGDWVENCTAIVETMDGEWKIITE